MNGKGNPNIFKNAKYGEGLTSWHFIYFGYSREERKAYSFYQHKENK